MNSILKLFFVVALTAVLLTIGGHGIRNVVPAEYHRAAWISGVVLFCASVSLGAAIRVRSGNTQRKWDRFVMTGMVLGALLFVLFITRMHCFFDSSARGGGVSCPYEGD